MSLLQRIARRLGNRRFLKLMRFYPPYLGAGIRVREASPDLSHVEVEMPLTIWNQNFVGAHFGGSLYSMCDPFFMLMLMGRLGPDYVVWDKAASIEFVRPGRGSVTAVFDITDAQVEDIRRQADGGAKVLPRFEAVVTGADGKTVARIEKTLHVRRADSARRLRVVAQS
jgi:acyl-coenzyme A thioesterase PaaI-like protein